MQLSRIRELRQGTRGAKCSFSSRYDAVIRAERPFPNTSKWPGSQRIRHITPLMMKSRPRSKSSSTPTLRLNHHKSKPSGCYPAGIWCKFTRRSHQTRIRGSSLKNLIRYVTRVLTLSFRSEIRQLPASTVLPVELIRHEDVAVASGGLANVFKREYQGTLVAVKVFRVFPPQHSDEAKKVRVE